MANEYVKFYRLGSSSKDSSVSYEQYQSYITGDASVGGIVFARVYDPEKKKTTQYIWANGIEYNLGAGSSNAKIDVSTADPSVFFEGKTPSHGDYYVKEEYVSDNVNVEPRRTAYIFDSTLDNYAGNWVALDGNVNATNVYFPEGFQRTIAWGTATGKESTDSDPEIVGKNLKEVFEHYLVKELYKGTPHDATFTTSSWSITSNAQPRPNDLYTYIKVNGTTLNSNNVLKEVGLDASIAKIEVKANPTYTPVTSKNGTAPYIDNMFKYSNSQSSSDIQDASSKTGVLPSATFSYVDNFGIADPEVNTATATLALTVNSSSFSNASESGAIDSSVALSLLTATLKEGIHTLTLSYSNDLSASRSISAESVAAVQAWPVSNKGNVSTGALTANGITPSDKSSNGTSNANAVKSTEVSNKSTNVTITAVYAIYTNGKKVTTSDSYTTINTGWYQDNYLATYSNKLPILNYYSNTQSDREIMLSFGLTNANNGHKCLIYVPTGMTFDVPLAAVYDSANKFEKWAPNTSRTSWVKLENTVTINSKAYDVYENDSLGVGTGSYKIVIGKKS